ncbi:MAG: hypothetical protein ACOYK8_01100 [Alphaproteobacteria bacterium]
MFRKNSGEKSPFVILKNYPAAGLRAQQTHDIFRIAGIYSICITLLASASIGYNLYVGHTLPEESKKNADICAVKKAQQEPCSKAEARALYVRDTFNNNAKDAALTAAFFLACVGLAFSPIIISNCRQKKTLSP